MRKREVTPIQPHRLMQVLPRNSLADPRNRFGPRYVPITRKQKRVIVTDTNKTICILQKLWNLLRTLQSCCIPESNTRSTLASS